MNNLAHKLVRLKYLFIVIALLICFVPKIYTSESEVGMRAVVTSLGIDKTDSGYEVTAQAFIPTMEDSKSEAKTIVSAEDKSLASATSKFTVKLGRVTTLAHCKLLVLGNRLIEEGCLPAMDFTVRNGKVSWNSIVVATEGTAKDAITKINLLEQSSSFSWKSYLSNTKKYTKSTLTDLKTFMNSNYSTAKSAYLTMLNFNNEEKQNDQEQENTPTSTISESVSVALIKEGKKVAMLEDDSAEALSWLDKDCTGGTLSVKNVGGEYYDGGIVSVMMDDKTIRQKYCFKDGKPHLNITIEAMFEEVEIMRDYPAKTNDLQRTASRKLLEEKLEQKAREDIESMLKICADNNVDAINLSAEFNRFAHKQYKEYLKNNSADSLLSDITLNFKMTARVK